MISRREFVTQAAGILLLGTASGRLLAEGYVGGVSGRRITIYKSRTCGCCAEWVDYLQANGFATTVQDEEEMDRLKDELGVPQALRSCHTAVTDQYLIEGHVPAPDIHRILAERPKIAGLAAPGMPAQSPGMAEPGAEPRGYDVLAFQRDGTTRIFVSY
jgi:hypothetical protein